jgi:hypothetical protein
MLSSLDPLLLFATPSGGHWSNTVCSLDLAVDGVSAERLYFGIQALLRKFRSSLEGQTTHNITHKPHQAE